jgi:leucyl-tRNA synthetase
MVIAPEHPLVDQITTPEQRESVTTYVKRTERESALQRQSTQRSFTGVFTGAHAINPVNQEHIPIWIADYVLADYGTGAIMAVPAHDQRDFEFARKYNLPIRMVYESPDAPRSASEMTQALAESGVMINSGEFNGSPNNKETISRFIDWLQSKQLGKARITYKLRDWLVSRQRYWGVPIPIIHCPSCGPTAVPDSDLPVKLPDVENFHPPDSGESPLATIEDFVNTKCPDCSKPARRETDTMAGFACSSWYFLRYADPQNNQEFAASDKLAYWLPVDLYTGGTEHAVMHLLYARFWTKVMYDAGLVSFTEPFRALRNQGTMLAWTPGRRPRQEDLTETEEQATTNNQIIDWIVLKPEERAIYPADQIVWRWARMSKSKGNGINPDDIINENGADCLRLYILFVAPFEDNVQWSENGLVGASRFINRLWRWVINAMTKYDKNWDTQHPSSDNWTLPMDRGISAVAARTNDPTSLLAADKLTPTERQVRRKLHQTVRKVGNDLENFQFNTAVAALMELVNELYAYCPAEPQALATANGALLSEILSKLIPITAPLIPHVADEFWSRLGKNTCLSKTPWPDYDQEICREDEVTLVVQVNGKIRDRIPAPIDAPDETLRALALSSPLIADFIKDKTIVKIIVVPNKLVNIVVK